MLLKSDFPKFPLHIYCTQTTNEDSNEYHFFRKNPCFIPKAERERFTLYKKKRYKRILVFVMDVSSPACAV